MVMGMVITAVVAIAGCVVLRVLARSYIAAAGPAIATDDAQVRPGLVHFVMTSCKPGTAAYSATILDLAARGFLGVSTHPTGLWLTYTEAGARSAGTSGGSGGSSPLASTGPLAAYEQRVLDAMHGRLKNTGGAPLTVLTETCQVDVEGTWTPFEESLHAEAKRRGICRRKVPLNPAIAAVASVTSAAVGIFVGLFVVSRPHAPHGDAIGYGIAAAVIFPLILAGIGSKDRLTPLGASLFARWGRAREDLAGNPATWGFGATGSTPDESQLMMQRRAFAAALAIPGASGGPVAGISRSGRIRGGAPSENRMPTEAWSSFTGSWRLVKIQNTARLGMGCGIGLLVAAAFIGCVGWLLTIPSGTEPWPLLVGAIGFCIGIAGLVNVAKVSAIPRQATFDAQVIARWHTADRSDDGPGKIAHFAADDGTKTWTFGGPDADRVGLEDIVKLTVNPRTGDLIEMNVIQQQRPQTPTEGQPEVIQPRTTRPAEPLLTDAEIATLIGPVSRTTAIPSVGSGHGTIYRGSLGTLSLVVAGGGIARFNTMISAKTGTPLGGVGDAAWLMNSGRTAIVRLGDQVAKITVSGAGVERRPDLLANLAAAVATRMSQRAAGARPPVTGDLTPNAPTLPMN